VPAFSGSFAETHEVAVVILLAVKKMIPVIARDNKLSVLLPYLVLACAKAGEPAVRNNRVARLQVVQFDTFHVVAFL
jgi:hypothetical protein